MCGAGMDVWNSNAEPMQPRGDETEWAMRQLSPMRAAAQANVWRRGRVINLQDSPCFFFEPSAIGYAEILDPGTITQHAMQPITLVDGVPHIEKSSIARVQYLASIASVGPRPGTG